MAIVTGKNVVVTTNVNGTHQVLACAQDITLNEETEMIPATTATSKNWRDYKAGINGWSLELSGLKFLKSAGKFVLLDMFKDSVRTNGVDLRVIFTDEDGDSRILAGSVLVPNKSITANSTGFAKGTINCLGTGKYVLSGLNSEPVAPDEDPPVIQSAFVTNAARNVIVMVFQEGLLEGGISISDFALNLGKTPTLAQVIAERVYLTVNSNYSAGDDIRVTYTGSTIKDIAGNASSSFINYPVQNLIIEAATFTARWGWDLGDPYASIFIIGDATITNWQSGTFAQGGNISTDFSSMPPYRYAVMEEPISEPVKISFEDTGSQFNTGLIPSAAFRAPVVVGAKRYYISRNKIVFDNNASSRVIFKK